jgi:hypothetical protein
MARFFGTKQATQGPPSPREAASRTRCKSRSSPRGAGRRGWPRFYATGRDTTPCVAIAEPQQTRASALTSPELGVVTAGFAWANAPKIPVRDQLPSPFCPPMAWTSRGSQRRQSPGGPARDGRRRSPDDALYRRKNPARRSATPAAVPAHGPLPSRAGVEKRRASTARLPRRTATYQRVVLQCSIGRATKPPE